jgi:hypothetical protein
MKRLFDALPYLIAALGFITCVVAYYPGILEPDSLDQLSQAQSGRFDDWHPPIMALLWRGLNFLYFGPQLLFLLHLAMFWASLVLIGRGLTALGAVWGWAFPAIGFAPWMLPLLGVLISDVAVVSAWMFAAALLFYRRARGEQLGGASLVVAALAFAYGTLARANTIFAAAALVFYGLSELAPNLRRLRWGAAALTPAAVLGAAALFNAAVASSDYPTGSLQTFDLGGISHFTGRNMMPGRWSAADASKIVQCYQPDGWDIYEAPACAQAASKLQAENLWTRAALSQAWIGAIAQHPSAYIQHRLDYANHFFRWLGRLPPGALDFDTEPDAPPAFAHPSNAVYEFYADLAETDYVALRPYFWLALGVGVLVLACLAQPSPAQRLAQALGASSLLYLLFYIVVGVASDYRYALWSIAATMTAAAALALCQWRKLRLALGAVCGAVVMGAAIAMAQLY